MVEVDELHDPALQMRRQTAEGETPRSPPYRRLMWGRLQGKPVKAPFEEVWQVERPRVWALAARLTGSRDDAEDVAQEVAVRALRSWDSFRGDANVRTWLFRITLNVVSRHRSGHQELPPTYAEVAAPRCDQPEERLLRAEGVPAVRRALDALPEELRTPLVLQIYEEMKCREIADLLGLPLGTVLFRLYTARKRLLTLLSEGNSAENAL
jgi:RNA polymerase sigma-70 factor (ECF subfamily)